MAITLANLALGGIFLYGLLDNDTDSERVDIYRQRDIEGLNKDTQDIIKLITFSDSTDPVGSFKYKVHKYPGDIDIFEPVKICCDKATATRKIVAELKDIARKVQRSKGTFWGDFKAGIDFALQPGPDMSVEDYAAVAGQYLNGEQLARAISDFPASAREFYVVRWTGDDVIRGSKTLYSGKQLDLAEAITHDAIVKLDLWAPVDGNYTEITNFFLFVMQNKGGQETVLNAQLGDRLDSLNHDIVKYGSKQHWNPLKLAKRLWNKALFTKDHKMTNLLYPLFSSGAAQLHQIAGECEVLRFMFQKLSKKELDTVRQRLITQILGFKRRVNDVSDIDLGDREHRLYRLLDAAAAAGGSSLTVSKLLEVEAEIKVVVDQYSERYLAKIGLRPKN